MQQTPTDILTILQAADAEFEDDIDAISNTSLTPTPTPLPTTPPARDGHVELQDLPTQMANEFLESLSSKENVDRELQLLAGSYKLPETLIAAVKKYKTEQQLKEQHEHAHEHEELEQDEQNKTVKN